MTNTNKEQLNTDTGSNTVASTGDTAQAASRPRRILVTAIGVAAAAGILASAGSHLVYHRSLPATAAEMILAARNSDVTYEDEAASLAARAATEDPGTYSAPTDVSFDEEFAEQTFGGLTTYYLNSSNHSNISILYLHGGGYISGCGSWQWQFANTLANETDAEIIVPDYPIAPWHTYEETYELLYDWWVPFQYGNESRILVIMGDSAGGGLALGFTEYLKEMDAALPNALVLISPWVDLTMSNAEIADYEDVDPMLCAGMSRAAAEAWAGDTELTDYRLSPIYGDLKGLPDTTILTGTREILYPDTALLYDRLVDAGNYVTLIVGEGLNHDYPLYPIPEGREAISQIAERITALTE